jgi:hypothetical protein
VIFCTTCMTTDQVNDTYDPTTDPIRKAKSGPRLGLWLLGTFTEQGSGHMHSL